MNFKSLRKSLSSFARAIKNIRRKFQPPLPDDTTNTVATTSEESRLSQSQQSTTETGRELGSQQGLEQVASTTVAPNTPETPETPETPHTPEAAAAPPRLKIGIPAVSDSLLLNLPGELRMLIWEQLLDDADNQWPFIRELVPLGLGTSSGPNSAPGCLGFLLACRRVYHDAWALAYKSVVFHLQNKTPEEEDISMHYILVRRASRLPKEKLDTIQHISISTFIFQKEETDRRKPTKRFSMRSAGLNNVASLTVWKMKEKPGHTWDGCWFANQVLEWVMSMGRSATECSLNINLMWKYAERGVVPTDLDYSYAENSFAHSIRRSLNSASLRQGLRERTEDGSFEDWHKRARTIRYDLRRIGSSRPTKHLRVQVLSGRDVARLELLASNPTSG